MALTDRNLQKFLFLQLCGAGLLSLLFAFTGILGSETIDRFAVRLLFWLLINLPLWLGNALIIRAITVRFSLHHYTTVFLAFTTVACLFSFPSTLWVHYVVQFFYGTSAPISEIFITILLISLCINFMVWLFTFFGNNNAQKITPLAPPKARGNDDNHKLFINRLPVEKQGALLSLQAADHYVEVTTDKGTALLLMRMQDAIELLGDDVGVQIHRSHWVSHHAIKRIIRQAHHYQLELNDGTMRPISRRYLKN